MDIIFYGQSFFELIFKNQNNQAVKLALDPFDASIGLKQKEIAADIALISHGHRDHDNLKAFSGKPFVIDSLGEYEIKDVFIKGIRAFHDNVSGKERGLVNIFKIEADGLKLCFLSDLGQEELTDEQVEEIGEVDVLFCPVGGVYTIGAKEAAHVISQIEPRVVIPMHYKLPGLKIELEEVDKFLKQMGQEDVVVEAVFKATAKSLPMEETKIVVLKPQS